MTAVIFATGLPAFVWGCAMAEQWVFVSEIMNQRKLSVYCIIYTQYLYREYTEPFYWGIEYLRDKSTPSPKGQRP